MMGNNNLKSISEAMIDRYSKRLDTLGYDVKTLGWGSVEQQEYRFAQTVSSEINFRSKSILDIGCGFGDYYKFLEKNNVPVKDYQGLDINPNLIAEANEIYKNDDRVNFKVSNVIEEKSNDPIADVGVMLGVLNLNLKEKYDNYEYSFKAIKNAFSYVEEVLVVDFLSTNLTEDYEKEDFVFYHDPIKMLEFGLTLSSNVVVKQNYLPIPQREFMLFIYKS